MTRFAPGWPSWAPGRSILARVVGVLLIAAGLSIVFEKGTRMAALSEQAALPMPNDRTTSRSMLSIGRLRAARLRSAAGTGPDHAAKRADAGFDLLDTRTTVTQDQSMTTGLSEITL